MATFKINGYTVTMAESSTTTNIPYTGGNITVEWSGVTESTRQVFVDVSFAEAGSAGANVYGTFSGNTGISPCASIGLDRSGEMDYYKTSYGYMVIGDSGAITFVPQSSIVNGTVYISYSGSSPSSFYYFGIVQFYIPYTKCSVPSSISISSSSVYPGTDVTLSWSGASSGTLNNISGYYIYRSTAADGTYSEVSSYRVTGLSISGTDSTSRSKTVASSSTNGETYYYKILTVGTVSGYSSDLSSYRSVKSEYSAPSAPTSVTAASTNVAPGATVRINWSGASAGTNNAISSYTLYRSTSASGSYTALKSGITTAYYDVTAPTTNSSYYYKVVTVGAHSSSGLSSVTATLTTYYTAPSAPSTVAAASTNVAPGATARINWSGASAGTNNAIASYTLYRSTSSSGSYTALQSGITTAYYDVTAPTTNSSYYYKVVTVGAHSSSGLSSATATLTTSFSAPSTPSNLSLSANNVVPGASSASTLSWSASSSGTNNPLTGYRVYRSTASDGTYSQLGSDLGTSTRSLAVDAPSASGNSYFYKVVAIGTYSNSGYSSYAQLTALVTAPGAPTSVTASATTVAPGATVRISWSGATAGTNNAISSYTLYRSTSATGTYSSIASGITGTSYDVTSPTDNSSYYYKVVTVGARSSSGQSSAYATVTTSLTAPGTISDLALSSTYVKSGSVTLSWAAASGGTNNPIVAYEVFRGSTALGTTTGTSMSVACAPAGQSYTFSVRTNGTYSNSGLSEGVTLYTYTECTPPSSVVISNTHPIPDAVITLSWSGAAAGSYNSISNYVIYTSNEAEGEYTELTRVSSDYASVTAPSSAGTQIYYKVAVLGVRGTIGSLSSVYAAITVNGVPAVPSIRGSGVIYNPNPRHLITLGADYESAVQILTASGYTLSRSTDLYGGDKVLAKKTTTIQQAGTAATISVTQTDPYGAASTGTATATYTVIDWTDDPIVSGYTPIRAAHVNEIRAALDNICDYYGLEETNWAEEIIAGVTSDINFPVHIAEIHATIRRIAAAINAWDATTTVNNVSLPTLVTSLSASAAVINQLREVITLL